MNTLSIYTVLEEQCRNMPAEEFGGFVIDLVSYSNVIEIYVNGRLCLDSYKDHVRRVGTPNDISIALRFLDYKLALSLLFEFDESGFPIGVSHRETAQ